MDYRTAADGPESGYFDYYFVQMLKRLDPGASGEVLFAAAAVRRAVGDGHACIDLNRLAEPGSLDTAWLGELQLPEGLGGWKKLLAKSTLVGGPEAFTPLVLDGPRLYLRRYWRYEQELATMLLNKAAMETIPFPEAVERSFLEGIFVNAREPATAEHLQAAETAVHKGLTVISGGPGTGKTSVVARILVLLQALGMERGETRRILLLAPTGKAAARLGQAMVAKLAAIEAPASIKAEIPRKASTIHRILAAGRGGGPANLRPASVSADIVVIDEASMVDLSLLHRLLQALPEKSRLILLGDRDQLASVEAGSIFSDICDAGAVAEGGEGAGRPPLHDAVVRLRQSFRFSGDSGIARLAGSVKNGEAEKVLELLATPRSADFRLVEYRAGEGRRELEELMLQGYLPVFSAFNPHEALNRMERFRLLCAHRQGPDSAGNLNDLAELLLHREGLIAPGEEGGWYRGRPLLITRNCYPLGLYNGDTGILWPDEERGGELRAFFYGAEPGTLRSIAPSRLPPHDTAYAMTIHKSQGSEFDEVAVVLPGEMSPVLSRELLYTALTRARARVTLYGTREIIGQTVLRKVDRASGLVDLLRIRQF